MNSILPEYWKHWWKICTQANRIDRSDRIIRMSGFECLLDDFVQQSRNILEDNLVGIYLHGSAVMGCFNNQKSDIDLLIVIKDDISNEVKRQYMDMVLNFIFPLPT